MVKDYKSLSADCSTLLAHSFETVSQPDLPMLSLGAVSMSTPTFHNQSQRKSLSCTQCARRKLRCSKTIPCLACIDRGNVSLCQRRDEVIGDSPVGVSNAARRSKRRHIEYEALHPLDTGHQISTTPGGSTSARGPRIHSDAPFSSRSDAPTPSEVFTTSNTMQMVNDMATDTPVTLEFLSLSRRRVLRSGLDRHGDNEDLTITSPERPDPILSTEQVMSLLEYHKGNLSWTHNVVHLPTFQQQCRDFVISGVIIDRAWPALYYSMLATSLYHMHPVVLATIGINNPIVLAEAVYQMCLDHLQDADFMAAHHICSVQAICLLIYVGHNLGQSDRLCVLLASAIRIAQCLGMHRLGQDGPHHTEGLDTLTARQTLIDREVQKRTWWFLIRQDWLQIPYVNTYTVHPSQFNTPMPSNCYEDPDAMVDDNCIATIDKDVYTQGSFTSVLNQVSVLIWTMQDRMCRLGHPQKAEDGLRKLYEEVLRADAHLKKLMREMPVFYREDANCLLELPRHIHHQRQVMLLTLAHKFYSIHRHFQVLSFKDPWYAYSKVSCLSIVLHSLPAIFSLPEDEYTHIVMNLWTVNTQIITGVIWVMFELLFTINNFDRMRSASELRQITHQALISLEVRQNKSRIARNGVRVIRYLSEIDKIPREGRRKAFEVEDIIAYVRSGGFEHDDVESESGLPADWDVSRFEEWIPCGDTAFDGFQSVFDRMDAFNFDFESGAI